MVLKQRCLKICLLLLPLLLLAGCAAVRSHHAFLRGVELYERGDYDAAARKFEKVADHTSDTIQARLYHGWCHYFREALDDAETEFASVLAEPNLTDLQRADACHGLARIAYLRKEYDIAARNAACSLERVPENTGLRLLLGWSRIYLGRFKDAETAFRQVLNSNPNSTEARLGLGWALYDQGRSRAALDAADRILKHSPEDISALELKGRCLIALKQYDNARTCFETILKLDPANPTARENVDFLDAL